MEKKEHFELLTAQNLHDLELHCSTISNVAEIDKQHAVTLELIRRYNEQQKIIEKQNKENTDLKELYIRLAKNFDKKGQVETAEYMLAQIEAIPTFTTWEEYVTWVSKDKIREILEYYGNTPADNPDTTIAFYSDIKKILEEK